MNNIICEYCNKTINKSNKQRHERSKGCIINKPPTNIISCKYCDETFTRLDTKNVHEKNVSCNAKIILFKMEKKDLQLLHKDKEIEMYKDQKDKEIEMYKDQIKRLEEEKKLIMVNYKPGINNSINNSINNKITCKFIYVNINLPEDLIEVLPKLTIDDHKQGGNGYGLFIMKHVANGKIFINDSSRMIMSYMLNNVMVKDDGTQLILECLKVFDDEQRRLINTGLRKKYSEDECDVILTPMLYVGIVLNRHRDYEDVPIFKYFQNVLFKYGEKK